MEVGSSKYSRLCKWPRQDQPWCPCGLGGLDMLRSIKWGPSVSRRKANTTINLFLRFLDVQPEHGEMLANAVVEACTGNCVQLLSDHNKGIKWKHKCLTTKGWTDSRVLLWCVRISSNYINVCYFVYSGQYSSIHDNTKRFSSAAAWHVPVDHTHTYTKYYLKE